MRFHWRWKPLRWLLGLPFLALLGALALFGMLSHIQDDLRIRAVEALQGAGYEWPKVDFDGRDAKLSGEATTEQEQQATLDAIRGTWGVRVINDESSLIQALTPYLWSVKRDGRTVNTDGYAANDLDRKSVSDAAAKQLRGLTVHQSLKLARGMPPRERWLAAIGFASAQMAGINNGEAKFEDLNLSVRGQAASPQAYEDIEKAIHGALPDGVVLAHDDLVPPDVKPFVWSAELQGQTLTLGGLVPGSQERVGVLNAARAFAPNGYTVIDHMLPAGGAPSGWLKAVEKSLGAVLVLKSGSVKFSDARADLRGVADEQDIAESTAKAFHDAMPVGFTATQAVTFLKVRIPLVSPYIWSAQLSGKSLDFAGSVPDDKIKGEIAAYASQRINGVKITDRSAIARGEPAGFEQAALAAIDQLAKLDRGAAKLTNRDLELSGHAPEVSIADGLLAAVATALPSGYSPNVSVEADKPKLVVIKPPEPAKPVEPAKPAVVAVKPPEPPKPVAVAKPVEPSAPYVWDAVLENGVVTVSGGAPAASDRDMVLGIINERMSGVKVVNNMTLVTRIPSGNTDWLMTIDTGLKAIADLGGGHASIADQLLTVSGSTSDKAMPDYIAESLRRATPLAYHSASQVAYAAPPTPAEPQAYTTKLRYSGLKVEVNGSVPDQAAKASLFARLKALFPDRDFDDQTTVQSGAPPGWLDAILQGLIPLSVLDKGELTLRDRKLILSGSAQDQQVIGTARQKVNSGLPKGYGGEDQLTYVPPPLPDPKLLAKRQDENKYDVGRLMKQSSLSAPECQAVLNSLLRGKAFFASGRADLDARAAAVLGPVVAFATRCPSTRVEISGHTDSDGPPTFNQRLSELRAQAVVRFLSSKGVSTDRLKAVGYGENQPIAPNNSFANKAKNRRIDFSVSPG